MQLMCVSFVYVNYDNNSIDELCELYAERVATFYADIACKKPCNDATVQIEQAIIASTATITINETRKW